MTDALTSTLSKLGEALEAPGAACRLAAIRQLTPYASHPEVAARLGKMAADDPDAAVGAKAVAVVCSATALPGDDALEVRQLLAELLVSQDSLDRSAALAGLARLSETKGVGSSSGSVQSAIGPDVAARAHRALQEAAGEVAARHLAAALWELTGPGSRLPAEVAAALRARLVATRPAAQPEPSGPRQRAVTVSRSSHRAQPDGETARRPLATLGVMLDWLSARPAAWVGAGALLLLAIGLAGPHGPSPPLPPPAATVRPASAAALFRPSERTPIEVTGILVKLLPSRRGLEVLDDSTRSVIEVRLSSELPATFTAGQRVQLKGTREGTGPFGGAVVAASTVTLDSSAPRPTWGTQPAAESRPGRPSPLRGLDLKPLK